MAANVNRWVRYAKARIDAALGQGHEELDRLEAEREVELADKPWLRSDGDAPTFDEARARIEWEAEHQRRIAEGEATTDRTTEGSGVEAPEDATAGPGVRGGQASGSDRAEDTAEAAARESARLEMEERQRQSAARLEEIRRELGIDTDPPADGANG